MLIQPSPLKNDGKYILPGINMLYGELFFSFRLLQKVHLDRATLRHIDKTCINENAGQDI